MLKAVLLSFTVPLFLSASPVAAASKSARFFSQIGVSKPFSSAVRVGSEVYVSGAIGAGPDGVVPANFVDQAMNSMMAVSEELKLAGATMEDVYQCDVFLTDMKNLPAFNLVYVKHFKPGRMPVRMATEISGLAKGAAVEVRCDAHMPN